MKTIFTLSLILMIAIAGINSYIQFYYHHYYNAALLTVGWYISLSLLITVIGSRKIILK